MRVRAPELFSKGFRLGFGWEVLEAKDASGDAVTIDGPEVGVVGRARLDNLVTVDNVDHAARMHLDRIEVTDSEHPRGRNGKRGLDRVDRRAHAAPPFGAWFAIQNS